MRVYVIIIGLLILSNMNSIGSAITPNNSISIENNTLSPNNVATDIQLDDIWNHSTIEVPVETMAQKSGYQQLDGSTAEQFVSSPLEFPSEIEFVTDQVYQDHLQYETNFDQIWDQGVWDDTNIANSRIAEYDAETGITTLDVVNASGNSVSYNIVGLNIDISEDKDAYLEIDLNNYQFNLNEGDSGYVFIFLKFNHFDLHLVYDLSDDYKGFFGGLNNTDTIFLEQDTTEYSKINLTQIKYLANSSTPLILEGISFDAIKDKHFDFHMSFNSIRVMGGENDLALSINNEPFQQNKIFSEFLQVGEVIEIQTHPNWIGTIYYHQYHQILPVWDVELLPTNEGIKVMIEMKIPDQGSATTYYHQVSDFLTNVTLEGLSTDNTNTSHIIYTVQGSISFNISGQLKQSQQIGDRITARQGERIKINQEFSDYKLILLKKMNQKQVYQFEDIENITLPATLSKGKFSVWIIENTGSYAEIQGILPLSPAKLVSDQTLEIYQTKRYNIPIDLQNLTSGEIYRPNEIISTINGSLRSVDGNYGLLIEPGEFREGRVVLEINATHTGFIPVFFELRIEILPIEFKPTFSIQSRSINTTSIWVNIPELDRWDIGITLRAESFDRNSTIAIRSSLTLMRIDHQEIDINTSWRLNVTINLDQDLGEYSYQVLIESLDYLENQNSSGISLLVGGFGSVVIIIYRIYRLKQSDQVINF